MNVTITREKNYSRSYAYGREWVWAYLYTFDQETTGSLGHVYPAGVPVSYGKGIADLKAMLRRNWPGSTITEAWK